MTIDKKELNKLSPGERIKKLKRMEEDSKKEVDEIEKLIQESMQELKVSRIAEEITPEHRVVDISKLFETSSEQRLERTAREGAKINLSSRNGYVTLSQIEYDSYKISGLYATALSSGGTLTEEQRAAMTNIENRMNVAERYMTDSEKTASKLDTSRATLYRLKKLTGVG